MCVSTAPKVLQRVWKPAICIRTLASPDLHHMQGALQVNMHMELDDTQSLSEVPVWAVHD